MKKNLLILSAVAAGTAAFLYFLKRKPTQEESKYTAAKRQHHMTNVFSNAKRSM